MFYLPFCRRKYWPLLSTYFRVSWLAYFNMSFWEERQYGQLISSEIWRLLLNCRKEEINWCSFVKDSKWGRIEIQINLNAVKYTDNFISNIWQNLSGKITDVFAYNRYWSRGIHFRYYLLARANWSLLEASECQWHRNTKCNGHECFLWWICCSLEHVTCLGYEYSSCEHEEYPVCHLRPWSGWCFSWLVCYHQATKHRC